MPKVSKRGGIPMTPPISSTKRLRAAKNKAVLHSRRIKETISAAEQNGLIHAGKEDRISARVSHELLKQAKSRTGIEGTTELLEFALASIALEDHFLEAMSEVDGTVDPNLNLEF